MKEMLFYLFNILMMNGKLYRQIYSPFCVNSRTFLLGAAILEKFVSHMKFCHEIFMCCNGFRLVRVPFFECPNFVLSFSVFRFSKMKNGIFLVFDFWFLVFQKWKMLIFRIWMLDYGVENRINTLYTDLFIKCFFKRV